MPRITCNDAVRWILLAGFSAGCSVLSPWLGGPGIAVMAAVLVAALASSIGGFAFSAMAGAMLFHLDRDTIQVVQIMITCSIANQALMSWAVRRDIAWRALGVFLAGGAIGLPLGVWVLLAADRRCYTLGIGAVLLAYGAWMLLHPPLRVRAQHPALDMLAGALSGVAGGAAGFASFAITIWCGGKGWDKQRQRALFQPFILVMQIAGLLLISLGTGHGGAGFAPADLLCVPASLLGTSAGMLCYRRLSDRAFARAVNVLMMVAGLGYVV
jgi:uncharacterized membrane protein YfcA